MCIDFCSWSFMWYLAKCFLKVQVGKIYCFVVVRVISVYDLEKEIEQAGVTVTFVPEAKLRVTCQVIYRTLYNVWRVTIQRVRGLNISAWFCGL